MAGIKFNLKLIILIYWLSSMDICRATEKRATFETDKKDAFSKMKYVTTDGKVDNSVSAGGNNDGNEIRTTLEDVMGSNQSDDVKISLLEVDTSAIRVRRNTNGDCFLEIPSTKVLNYDEIVEHTNANYIPSNRALRIHSGRQYEPPRIYNQNTIPMTWPQYPAQQPPYVVVLQTGPVNGAAPYPRFM